MSATRANFEFADNHQILFLKYRRLTAPNANWVDKPVVQ